MRIATWNVNSVRQRLPHLLAYLKEVQPDVLCLQEIKCLDEQFPRMEIEELGYNIETHGQKTFNGVAILSKRPFEVARGLPGDENDSQSRYIEAVVPAGDGVVRVACVYLPNGNPVGTEKYPYKLAFLERLIIHTRELLEYEEPLVLAGDFNVIPDGRDATRPEDWVNDALYLAADALQVPRAHLARPDRRPARDHGRRRPLHVLGLSGGRLAEEQRHPHRPSSSVAAGRGQAAIGDDRQGDARARQGLRSYARAGRPGGVRRRREGAYMDLSSLFDLSGKTALVTGSSEGLGLAMARGLAAAGAAIILNGRDEKKLANAAKSFADAGHKVETRAFDVADEGAVIAAFEHFDAAGVEIDILINNAGIQLRKPMVDLKTDEWRRRCRYPSHRLIPGRPRGREAHDRARARRQDHQHRLARERGRSPDDLALRGREGRRQDADALHGGGMGASTTSRPMRSAPATSRPK